MLPPTQHEHAQTHTHIRMQIYTYTHTHANSFGRNGHLGGSSPMLSAHNAF